MIDIKYMGSKSRITKYIVPIIQDYINKNNIETYCEPFVGGANVIDKIRCKNKYGSDLNKYLIALLNHVKNNQPLFEEVPKTLYDKARTAYNNGDTSGFDDWEIGNIGFLASYNGRFFDGGYSKPVYEKTKKGLRYRDYYREAKDNIIKQAANLEDCTFEVKDYRECNPVDCFVYVDPPYANTKQYKNAVSFDYDEFWETMREWSQRNIVLISEQNAPDDFICIWEQKVSRSIKATGESKSTEKLFIWSDCNWKK